MDKIIKSVDEKKGILQITTVNSRFYIKPDQDKVTGLPVYKYVPSVTWVSSYYPKGVQFYKWLAQKGWDESESIKQEAGVKGSKTHQAIEDLLMAREVKMTDKYESQITGQEEELTLEEWECLMSFVGWFKETKIEIINTEIVVFSDKYNYAGTIDLLCKIDGKLTIVDFKTSQDIWPDNLLQISAYKHALPESEIMKDLKIPDGEEPDLAILQIGYRRNKAKWKYTEIEDKFDLFLATQKIWAEENEGKFPQQKDYPLVLACFKEVKREVTEEVIKREVKKINKAK